jgi:hypothetical protein
MRESALRALNADLVLVPNLFHKRDELSCNQPHLKMLVIHSTNKDGITNSNLPIGRLE